MRILETQMRNKILLAVALAGPSGHWNYVQALKFPNHRSEGIGAVKTFAISPLENAPLPGFSELTDYALAAPDQEDAGTCLYMSLTGILEWWTARLNPTLSREADGDVDLSERFTVNQAAALSREAGVKNWRTDTIEVFNMLGYAATNRSYPFKKGHFVHTANGYARAEASPEALFGTLFNWINEISTTQIEQVKLPHFKREVLYADPHGDQWNIGAAPANLVELIKEKLQERKAPVHLIYNHYGYWHATVIVGFDDEGDSQQCQFVEGFRKYMKEHPLELRKKADENEYRDRRNSLLSQARAQEDTSRRIEAAWSSGGGCRGKGTFYVRDSIYGAQDQPVYDYNPEYPEGKGHYSKRLISLEYDWVKYLANHATQIYAE
ncbi:MAG: hypothetical protein ABIR96_12280 [Bdellovibrionota bacterium]